MKLNPNIFVTADTHFGHDRLREIQGRPPGVDRLIVKQWNNLVSKHDTVLILGDLSFMNKEKTGVITNGLNGKKYLVRGNHDGQSEKWLTHCGIVTLEPIYKRFKDKYENYISVLFTHEPVLDLPEDWFNAHGHLHGNDHRGLAPTDRHYDVGLDAHHFQPIRLYNVLSVFWENYYGKHPNT